MIELQSDLEYVLNDRLKVSLDAIAQFCQRWNIVEFALFGSVLRDDFRPDSDVDVLVTYEPSHRLTLSHLLGMQEEIENLFHRCVDLVEKKIRRRLKPRLQKRSPPPRTQENNLIFTLNSSTRVGGFCLYRRGFNRRLLKRIT